MLWQLAAATQIFWQVFLWLVAGAKLLPIFWKLFPWLAAQVRLPYSAPAYQLGRLGRGFLRSLASYRYTRCWGQRVRIDMTRCTLQHDGTGGFKKPGRKWGPWMGEINGKPFVRHPGLTAPASLPARFVPELMRATACMRSRPGHFRGNNFANMNS